VVNDHGSLVGVISEKDCLKVMLAAAYHNRPMNTGIVKDYMSTKVTTISDDKDVLDVANEFLKTNFRRYPVVNADGKLVGQVSRRDILRAAQHLEATTWNKK
jgi:CBS domain-containing protein